jgi:hypothetical protein
VSSTYTIHIYKSIAEVPASWQASLPTHHNLDLTQLAAIENSKLLGMEPLYVMATQGDKVVGLMYAQLLRFKSDFLSQQNLNTFLRSASCLLLGCWPMKLLVFGHLFRHDGAYCYFADDASAAKIHTQMVETVCALNRHNAVMFKDLEERFTGISKNIEHLTHFDNDVSMELHIPASWKNFDDYKTALKHKYTQRCNKTLKSFTEVTIRDWALQDVQHEAKNIYKLYEQVTQKQSVTLGLLNETYFPIFKESMGDKLHCQGFYHATELVAFSSAIVQDGIYDMNYIGFDYSKNQSLQLYFNILFNCINNAIQYGCHTLVLGRTALEAKAILGCTPVQKFGYYKINNGFLRHVAQRISNSTIEQQGEQWKSRHPFSSEYYEQTKK